MCQKHLGRLQLCLVTPRRYFTLVDGFSEEGLGVFIAPTTDVVLGPERDDLAGGLVPTKKVEA
jgi:hypothetical protein